MVKKKLRTRSEGSFILEDLQELYQFLMDL